MNLKTFARMFAVMSLVAGAPVLADDVIPPKVDLQTPGGVSIPDGSFTMHVADLSIGSLVLDRFVLPPAKLPGVNDPYFGTGITNNFDIYVAPNYQKPVGTPWNLPARYHPIVHIGAGVVGVYTQPLGVNTTVSPFNGDARAGKLTMVGGAYIFTDSTGAVYTFTPSVNAGGLAGPSSQRIANIAFSDGRTQTFSYDSAGHLKLVNDSLGYAIVFDYNANGDVSAACGFNLSHDYITSTSTCGAASLKVTYGYTGAVLTSVTDLFGKTTTYTRNTTAWGSPITCVMPPGYTTCKVSNTVNPTTGQVSQQTLADGTIWQTSAAAVANSLDPEFIATNCDSQSGVADPNGKGFTWIFTQTSPCLFIDADGRPTSYIYRGAVLQEPWAAQVNEGTMLIEADFPEGNKYLAEYLGPFNSVSKETYVAKPGSGLPNLVKTYGYADCFTAPGTLQNCAKPIWIKDPNGNETDFTYASWGGILSEMLPPPANGGARPLKLYTYIQKYAYVKNSGGALVSTGVPIWVPSTMVQCQTAAGSSTAVCDAAATAPRLQTTYQYGADGTANNLLARGTEVKDLVTGATRLSCVSYDPIGRKISETSPRGTAALSISVCP